MVVGLGAKVVCVKSQRLCAVADMLWSDKLCDGYLPNDNGLVTFGVRHRFWSRVLAEVRKGPV